MADLDRLKQRILDDAGEMEKDIIRAAEADAKAILKNAAAQADALEAEITAKAKEDAAAAVTRLKSVQESDRRKAVLRLKQDLIDEVFSKALAHIAEMPAEGYFALLGELIGKSVKTGAEEILLSANDYARMPEGFEAGLKNRHGAGLKLRNAGGRIAEGFIVRDGDVEINNSFEAVIKMYRNEMEAEINGILFR